ncbi:MAG: matrixin family metalloprotease [Bacteriovoracaceae bacterium]
MGKVKLLFIILLFQSCMGSDEIETPSSIAPKSSSSVTSSTVFGKWDSSLLPNETKISSSFTSDEVTAIEQAMDDWSTAVNDKLTFFKIPTLITDNKEYTKLDDFNDSEMGIYKSSKWYSEIGPYALAITQYWGVKMNSDTTQEYIDIVHADVIVNYHDHSFSINPIKNEYDLQSVIVHELGHFIGLSHQAAKASSVMASSISARAIRRTISSLDITTINSNYSLKTTTQAAIVAAQTSDEDIPSDDQPDPVMVRGIFELRADGSCGHYTVTDTGELIKSTPPKALSHHH